MKRIVWLIVLVIVAANLAHHRREARSAERSRVIVARDVARPTPPPPAAAPRPMLLVVQNGAPCTDPSCPLRDNVPGHSHPGTVAVPSPTPPVAPVPPVPPAPPVAVAVPPEVEAHATIPAWFRQDDERVAPGAYGAATVLGPLSSTEAIADQDARKKLDRLVSDWLVPDVPRSWTPPRRLVDAMIAGRHVAPEVKDYGDAYILYRTGYRVDFSPGNRARLVEAYNRELVGQRLGLLGGLMAFVLACLAALAGYIRADEATKGYYTNRLRLVAAAGVGAAGMAIYHTLI